MPTLTFTVSYDGSDQEIINTLGRIGAALANGNGNGHKHNGQLGSPNWVDTVAAKFAGFVFQAASRGEKSQKAAMETWLKHDGNAPLPSLVKASGVSKTHDYSGVGSSLSRNMKKSGGPKKWYDVIRDSKGERIYKISHELVGPLKKAFNI